jgi:hypothetical protein
MTTTEDMIEKVARAIAIDDLGHDLPDDAFSVEHDDGCPSNPWTCLACQADNYVQSAKAALSSLSLGDPLPGGCWVAPEERRIYAVGATRYDRTGWRIGFAASGELLAEFEVATDEQGAKNINAAMRRAARDGG